MLMFVTTEMLYLSTFGLYKIIVRMLRVLKLIYNQIRYLVLGMMCQRRGKLPI
jgi:hypothetical protein